MSTTSTGPAPDPAPAPAGRGRGYSPEQRTEALVEALPYIQQFRGSIVVVKLGGNAMADGQGARTFAQDIVMLRSVGLKPVVVHGGGPQIDELLARLGKQSTFHNGLRVTDAETLDVVRMVLVGKVGRDIVGQINVHGAYAVGLSGEDGGLITAEIRQPELGYVGEIVAVNPGIIQRLLAEDLIPVVSSIGSTTAGQALNINADTVAAEVASALKAEKLILVTDVEGILRGDKSLISRATPEEIAQLIKDGVIKGGMIPKAQAAVEALKDGVQSVHIISGKKPSTLLAEVFTEEGSGTMIHRG